MAESSKGEYRPVLTCSRGEYGPVLTCSRGEYEKILQAHGVNMRKYWLVEVIENGCIMTKVKVYNEILPEPSGNPSGSFKSVKVSSWLGPFIVLLSSAFVRVWSLPGIGSNVSCRSQGQSYWWLQFVGGRQRGKQPGGTAIAAVFDEVNNALYLRQTQGELEVGLKTVWDSLR